MMMPPATYARYSRILRTLRGRGLRLGLLEMGAVVDLVMAQERGEADEAERIRGKLGLSVEEIAP